MAISLYDLSVGQYLQILGATAGVLEKGLELARETGVDPDSYVGERLCGDMLPMAFQIASVKHHSLGAIEACKTGHSGPPSSPMPQTYADLQAMVAATIDGLKALTPDEVDALQGRDVIFQIGEMKLPFTAEGYILSFALPNFYFHATTAYDILRMKGAKLGKRNFLGAMKLKG